MKKLYLNGKIISESDACISPHDRGLLLGDGLFETLHAYAGRVIFLRDHWERLQHGAETLRLFLPFTFLELQNTIAELLHANQLDTQDAGLRLTVTRGPAPRGLLPPDNCHPTVLLTVVALQKNTANKTCSAHISKICRNELSPLANIKNLNYLESVLALQDAKSLGADEAILVNTKGNLVEATTANLFIIQEKKLLTPSITEGALPGVTRKIILRLANELKIPAQETVVTHEDLLTADEAFLTGSLRGVTPLVKVDEKIIGNGECGALTKHLADAFYALITKLQQ